MIVVNRVIKSFVDRIRENLLEFDFDPLGHVDEAPDALALGRRVGLATHQNAIVERLETHVNGEARPRSHADYGVTETVWNDNIQLLLAHLARAVHEIEHRHGVRSLGDVGHEEQFYSTVRR